MTKAHLQLALAVFAGLLLLASSAQAKPHPEIKHDPEKAAPVGMAYPLDYCIVTGEKLGSMGDVVFYQHEGREIRFCCAACIETFEAKAADYIAKIDAAIIEQQLPYYPLDTCPVTGEALDSMGGPVDIVVNNRLVRLCCAGCEKAVRKDPAKVIAELDEAAIKAQSANYPAELCPVMDIPDGGAEDSVQVTFAGRLLRFCCEHCVEAFLDDPQGYMAKVYK
jgi:YHS domain-containing protein